MMKKVFIALSFVMLFGLLVATSGFAGHEKRDLKGTVTKIEAVEYEITVKDDNGKEEKIRVKDTGDIKIGDNIVIQSGKVKKAVKPITGGY